MADGSEPRPLDIAIVGAGWAGLAAAVEATLAGAHVTLFEMAPAAGGRARDVAWHGRILDNGSHICIGAYVETLRLLRTVGVEEAAAFDRRPLTLVDCAGRGLRMRPGPPIRSFALAVLGRRGWSLRERVALLGIAARWRRSGFRCAPDETVAALTASLPTAVRAGFIEPLCVAALNTPAAEASGSVFLRVLQTALAGSAGGADMLLPRLGLGQVLPAPALTWLERAGATIRLAHRVDRLERVGSSWQVDGERTDAVVVAASAVETARLVGRHSHEWAARALALRYEPIATVYALGASCRLPEPLIALRSDATRPAQFVFDLGQLGREPGLLAFVISGAAAWVERGSPATEAATLAQASEQLAGVLRGPLDTVGTIVEKRATFACVPRLARPPMAVAPGLLACGDYIDGPFPATLEGAVRSGVAAARALAPRSGENPARGTG
ncbi:MAG TPA: hydroxysqualene dehydroxylase HpnE [Caldimonas sp.]|nr:hydroxysqualene dehydroxylase HpnE [Caldimonas sp.]HEX4235963.1 hydroxysqualene dehydroxylase HpnE [Caldimonas sp.]